MALRFPTTGPSSNRSIGSFFAINCGKILCIALGMLVLSHPGTPLFGQCSIQPQTVARQSADDLNIQVQGNCSSACHQIRVHWVNPPLPDKTVSVNQNTDDPSQPSTWSVPYGSADGLTLSMLVENFPCGSNSFSVEISCADVPGCVVTPPAGGLKVACKRGDTVCNIEDVDLHCAPDGRLTADTSVSSTGSETLSVTLTVTKDGQNVVNRSLSDTDGFVTISEDFAFAAGTYTVTTSVTAPPSCVHTRAADFTIAEGQCAENNVTPTPTPRSNSTPTATPTSTTNSTPTATPTPNTNPSRCPECSVCGGDWTCCVAWVFVFIGLLALIATIMYLICDPSGGGGWGWLILAIAAAVFAVALWWVIVHCRFDICRFLQILTAAFTVDLTMVCAIEGLFPCFSALICGVTVIAGVAIRNWFLILLVGLLIILGIQVACPLVG